MAGRPGKYSEELAQAICKSIANGVPECQAAILSDVNRDTIRIWKKKYPAFNGNVKKARAECLQSRIEVIMKAAKGGDEIEVSEKTIKHKDGKLERIVIRKKTPPTWTAAAWYLERQFCEQFGLNRLELKELLNLLRAAKKDKPK